MTTPPPMLKDMPDADIAAIIRAGHAVEEWVAGEWVFVGDAARFPEQRLRVDPTPNAD